MAMRTWTTLAIFSLYSLGAIKFTETFENSIKLPFVDILLPREWFLFFSLCILVAMLTYWIELINRATNTRINLIQPILDKEHPEQGEPIPIDIWDALVVPGSAAIWSAPFSLVGSERLWIRYLSYPYFFLLKFGSALVHYVVPYWTLYLIWDALILSHFPALLRFIIFSIYVLAIFQLIQILSVEIKYFIVALRRLHRAIKDRK